MAIGHFPGGPAYALRVDMKQPEIYCPLREWRPQADDRWHCMPSCGTVWHTFWTAGVRPGCGYRWQKTQCLSCQKISPHKDWYHFPPDSGEDADEREHSDRLVTQGER